MILIKFKKIIVLILIAISLYVVSFPARYYFYMWALNNWKDGDVILFVSDSLESMGSYIYPFLINTYKNTNASADSRHMAGMVLCELDKNRAENLFLEYLENKDDDVVVEAIDNLGFIKSIKPYDLIIQKITSSNYKIRVAVARYLENIRAEESIAILNDLMLNDPIEEVRETARSLLAEINRKEKVP